MGHQSVSQSVGRAVNPSYYSEKKKKKKDSVRRIPIRVLFLSNRPHRALLRFAYHKFAFNVYTFFYSYQEDSFQE